jgi:HK97 family phage portal protein
LDTLSLFTYQSSAGQTVNERTAMEVTAVSSAIRIIAESIASLPFCVYQKSKDGSKNRAVNHPLYTLLHDAPNPYMTAFVFWETVLSHMLLWGNAYAEIEWDNSGQVKALWLLRPDLTRPIVDSNGTLTYETVIDGNPIKLPFYRVLHIYGLGFDGLHGLFSYSPL